MSFFNETNFDNNKNQKKFTPYYSIKDNQDNIYRIAPSCRNLPKGEFAFFNKVHFGYSVPDDNNPDKPRLKTFGCVHRTDYKTKMTLVKCEECAKIDEVRAELDQMKVDLKNAGHNDDYIRQATMPQTQWLKAHNLDNKWYCYAKTQSGEWSILKIGHKTKLALQEKMKALAKEGVNPLDPASGVWFKFTKNGLKGPNAVTSIDVLREKIEMNGVRAEVIKSAPLTQSDEEAIAQLSDVTDCVTKLTPEQIKSLVDSGGSPEVARSIFALGRKTEGTQFTSNAPARPTALATPGLPGPMPTGNVILAAPVTAKTPPPAPVTVTHSNQEIAEMSPEKFLEMFKAQKG